MADFCIVLTMGRVASTSIQRSIEASREERVFHVHSITPWLLAKQVARKGGLKDAPRSALEGLEAVAEIARTPGRIKVVTLVREPVSRAYSAAFADLRSSHRGPEALAGFLNEPDKFGEWWEGFKDQRVISWFDQEIKEMLLIDVFQKPFPQEGWQTFEGERCDLLVLRSELDDGAKSKALSGFFEGAHIPILMENTYSRSAPYAPLYDQFKAQAELSDSYRSLLLDSQYNRHFYGR